MTTYVPPTNIVAGTAYSVGGILDTVYVLEQVNLISTEAVGLEMYSNNIAYVHGVIHGEEEGIRMGVEVGGGTVFVGDTGQVSSSISNAIQGTNGGDYSVTNHGEIMNSGSKPTIGFILSSEQQEFAGNHEIANYGLISNQTASDRGGYAIGIVYAGHQTRIVNGETGIISAVEAGSFAIQILGTENYLKEIDAPAPSEVDIFNSGQILGDLYSYVSAGSTVDEVINQGIMKGGIIFADHDDYYDGDGGRLIGELLGGSGDDTLLGGEFEDFFDADYGNDRLNGRGGNDALSGGVDNDTIRGGDGDDDIDGGPGDDLIYGGRGDDYMNGAAGNDTIRAGAGDDVVEGRNDDDQIFGQAGNDSLYGGSGQDTLRGGTGNDLVEGGNHDDTLYGNEGADTLSGGNGDDTFVFVPFDGIDTVTDYTDGDDLLDVTAFAFTSFASDIQPFMIQSGPDVVIDLSFGAVTNSVTLENTLLANIDASDFLV